MNPTDSGEPVRYLQDAVELNIGLANCNWVFLCLKAPYYKSLTPMKIVERHERTKIDFLHGGFTRSSFEKCKGDTAWHGFIVRFSVKFRPKGTQRTNHISDNKLRGQPTFVGGRVLKCNLTIILPCWEKQGGARKLLLSQVIKYGMLWWWFSYKILISRKSKTNFLSAF